MATMPPNTYPPYMREKARSLRRERKLTIDQLAERLALPRTTIYYWVRDLPIPRTARQRSARQIGSRAMSQKSLLREAAYTEGRESFEELARDATFRDFINLYLAEGYKRNRNCVSLCNSDFAVIRLADVWIRRLATNRVTYSLQYHADQDPDSLRSFWAGDLSIDPAAIRLQRKSNSNHLRARTWRSRHGVLTVQSNDTYLRARLQAWMDHLREEWLHSKPVGV